MSKNQINPKTIEQQTVAPNPTEFNKDVIYQSSSNDINLFWMISIKCKWYQSISNDINPSSNTYMYEIVKLMQYNWYDIQF